MTRLLLALAALLATLPVVGPAVYVALLERARLNLEGSCWSFDDLNGFDAYRSGGEAA